MSDAHSADQFAPHEGSDFIVGAPAEGILRLKLVRLTRHGIHPGAPRPDPFSLEFVGPPEPVLPQAIYAFEHPAMGHFDLFIVPLGPIGRTDARMRYEAVFN